LNIIKRIFTAYHHPKLVEILIESNFLGALAANIATPSIIAIVFYGQIPSSYLLVWVLANFFIFLNRVYILRKVDRALKEGENKLVTKYLNSYFGIVSMVSLFYGLMAWLSVIYLEDSYIFFMGMIMAAVISTSMSIFSSIFYIFVVFVVLQTTLFVSAFIYHGGEMFYFVAGMAVLLLVVTINGGYRQYITLKNAISLEETFKAIYNKSSDGIALIRNNRFIDCNEAIVKMFEHKSVEDVLKVHISNLMPKYQPDGSLSIKKMLKKIQEVQKRGSNEFEWLHKTRNGKEFWTQIRLTYIHLEGEDLIHGAWRDITDRKKLEKEAEKTAIYLKNLNTSLEQKVQEAVEEIKEKERALYQQSRLAQMGEMMSMIAHQWRQPLSAISATSSALNLKVKLGKTNKELIENMTDNISEYAQHLSQTIDDFRDFFKPTKGKKMVSFSELLKSALSIAEVSLANRNIRIMQQLEESTSFSSYPNELKQVLLNLIKNAEDALIENKIKDPFIKFVISQEGSKHILKVSDNGGGIPEDIIDKIFDPYFSTKKDKNGTGLGLYMSKIIVDDHCKGSLEVQNTQEGALFTITIDSKG
jgi:PAS domain S-box-containing protein